MTGKLNPLLKQLSGGDLRSIGESDKIVKRVIKDPKLIDFIFEGFYSDDAVIRMRTADVIEKVSRKIPEVLNPFKKKLINEISNIDQQEVQWHLAQIYPRLCRPLVILQNMILV